MRKTREWAHIKSAWPETNHVAARADCPNTNSMLYVLHDASSGIVLTCGYTHNPQKSRDTLYAQTVQHYVTIRRHRFWINYFIAIINDAFFIIRSGRKDCFFYHFHWNKTIKCAVEKYFSLCAKKLKKIGDTIRHGFTDRIMCELVARRVEFEIFQMKFLSCPHVCDVWQKCVPDFSSSVWIHAGVSRDCGAPMLTQRMLYASTQDV